MPSKEIEMDENSKLYIVGLRVGTSDHIIQFYLLYVDSERPLDCNGYPILFLLPDDYKEALAVSTCECDHLPIDSLNEFFCVDIAEMIYVIGAFNETKDANILDSLNMLLDFVEFLPDQRINTRFKKIMRIAADHFTFSKDIEALFQVADFSRFELIQAIEWSVGATVLYARYVY